MDIQAELPLPFPEFSGDLPLLPARMVNEYQYCPRLAYLEWVQGEWADSADTVEGCARSEASPELLKNHVQRGLAATPASTPR